MLKKIIFATLFATTSITFAQNLCSSALYSEHSKSFEESFKSSLLKDPQANATWKTLEVLGWKVEEIEHLPATIKYLIEVKPLSSAKSDKDILTHNFLTIKINKNHSKNYSEISKEIIKKELNALLNHPATQESYLVKWGTEMLNAVEVVHKNVAWPTGDALGSGYGLFFNKYKKDGFPTFGENSWQLSSDSKPSDFFSFLEKPASGPKLSSGCAVTLSLILNYGAFKTFNNPSVYDIHFRDLYLNNTTFYSTDKSLLNKPKRDTKGNIRANSRWSLIGQPAYIDAVTENVKHEDYFGENVIIVRTSDAALNELKAKGLGYFSTSMVRTEKDFKKFKGISQDMIQWWLRFHDTYEKIKDTKIDPSIIKRRCNWGNYHACYALEIMTTEHSLIGTPFFLDTIMFGHPAGQMSLRDWIMELATINPDTPYALMFYDYSVLENIYPKFINSNISSNLHSIKNNH